MWILGTGGREDMYLQLYNIHCNIENNCWKYKSCGFPPGTMTPCVWNRLNLSIVCHIILKMWHEPSFIYVIPWFLLAQASLWTAKVIGNKWDGPVGLQTHLLYLLCPDLIARSTLRTALHHTRVSRASPSSQPRRCPPFPSHPSHQALSPSNSCYTTSWPPLSARSFALPVVNHPTSFSR